MKPVVAVCAVLVLGLSPLVRAQPCSPPPTSAGKPDLQGVWSNQLLTNLTRFPLKAGLGFFGTPIPSRGGG